MSSKKSEKYLWPPKSNLANLVIYGMLIKKSTFCIIRHHLTWVFVSKTQTRSPWQLVQLVCACLGQAVARATLPPQPLHIHYSCQAETTPVEVCSAVGAQCMRLSNRGRDDGRPESRRWHKQKMQCGVGFISFCHGNHHLWAP